MSRKFTGSAPLRSSMGREMVEYGGRRRRRDLALPPSLPLHHPRSTLLQRSRSWSSPAAFDVSRLAAPPIVSLNLEQSLAHLGQVRLPSSRFSVSIISPPSSPSSLPRRLPHLSPVSAPCLPHSSPVVSPCLPHPSPILNSFLCRRQGPDVRLSATVNSDGVIMHEFKSCHEEWVNSNNCVLDPIIKSHMHAKLNLTDANFDRCESARNETRAALNALLKDDGILVIPTVADPPSKLGAKEIISDDYQIRAFSLLAVASMSGCCQATIPLGTHDKYPVSVSFIARHGGDRFLLNMVQTMYASLQEHVDIVAKSNLSNNAISQEESAEIAKEKVNLLYFFIFFFSMLAVSRNPPF
ncbi:hypothetical protein ACLOJK_005005 [Asimina triloba]